MTAEESSPDGLGIRLVAGSTGPRLMVGQSSAGLRRELGPVAWSALEILALAAQRAEDGRLVATLNVRQVAAALGVGREAAGKALTLLRRRELIVLEQSRRHGGHFTGTRYTVRIELMTEPELRQDRPTRRPSRVSAPTLFDTSTADFDDDTPEVSSSHDARTTTAAGDSQVVAREVTKIAHTLALSMPTVVKPDDARC